MTWDKATNLTAVARGGACAASGRGLIQRTYGAMGRVGEGSRGSCIEAVRKTMKGRGWREGGIKEGEGRGGRPLSTCRARNKRLTRRAPFISTSVVADCNLTPQEEKKKEIKKRSF